MHKASLFDNFALVQVSRFPPSARSSFNFALVRQTIKKHMRCTSVRAQPSAGRTAAKPRQQTVCHATRRQLGAQLLAIGAGLVAAAGASSADDKGTASPFTSGSAGDISSSSGATAISIAPINKSAKAYMDMRDDAMEYQCKGGMFDCDGDRRQFAHKQYTDWLAAGGVPKRIREGKPNAPRSY